MRSQYVEREESRIERELGGSRTRELCEYEEQVVGGMTEFAE